MDPTRRARHWLATAATLCLFIAALAPHPALAKTTTWTNLSPANDLWSNAGNWDNGVPVNNDDVIFGAVGGASTHDIPGLLLGDMAMAGYTGTLTISYGLDVNGDVDQDGEMQGLSFTVAGSMNIRGTLDAYGSTITTGGHLTVEGTAYTSGSSISLGGRLAVSGTMEANSTTIYIVGDLSVPGEFYATNYSLVTVGYDMDVTGTLDVTDSDISVTGQFSAGSGADLDLSDARLEVSGDATFSDVTSCTWGSDGRLRFTGNWDHHWTSGPGAYNYGDVEVNVGSGRVTGHCPGAALTVNMFDINSGTFELGSGDLDVDVNLNIDTNGTFENTTNTGATVQFDYAIIIDGTFRVTAGGCTLRFGPGISGTVDVNSTGTIEIVGAPGNLIRLEQDGVYGGTQWELQWDGPSTLVFDHVRVQDSNAKGGGTVSATNSEDGGNNDNWDFGGKDTIWTGAGPNDNWSEHLNWTAGVPQDNDDVAFDPVGGLSILDIGGLDLNSLNMGGFTGALDALFPFNSLTDVHTSGTVTLTGVTLNVGGALTGTGVLDASSATISVGGNISLPDTLDAAGASISAAWDMDVGTLNALGGAVILVGGHLHVAGNLDMNGILDVMGDVSAGAGANLLMNNSSLVIRSNLDFSAASAFLWSPIGTLRCEGAWDYGIHLGGAIALGSVRINNSTPGVTTTLTSATPVMIGGTLDVDTGTLELNCADVEVELDTHIDIGGAINGSYDNGRIDFDGTLTVRETFEYTRPGVTVTLHGNTSIEGDFRMGGDGSSLRVAPGTMVSVKSGGLMDITGGTGSDRTEMVLEGAPGSGQWLLDLEPGSTRAFDNIRVQDSDASPGETAVAGGECIDGGNNDNWNFVGTGVGDILPTRLSLLAVPNPFNPQTTIHYAVPAAGQVTIRIYDVRGAVVRTLHSGVRPRGNYSLPWDGTDDAREAVGSGVYFCRISVAGGERRVTKLVLLK